MEPDEAQQPRQDEVQQTRGAEDGAVQHDDEPDLASRAAVSRAPKADVKSVFAQTKTSAINEPENRCENEDGSDLRGKDSP